MSGTTRKDRPRDLPQPCPPEHRPMVDALLEWFQRNKRPLPWRKDHDPYRVWISEIMLQQTQMERGVTFYTRWMERFPTLASVADAHEDEVLKAWEGLGYYSRARNLHRAAKVILERHNGIVPADTAALRALPGIGEYTAGAVASIAYNLPEPAVDANVERVFARLFDVDAPVKSVIARDFFRHMAVALIPSGRAREFNQALMELGALVCGKKPECEICPLSRFCRAKRLGIPQERPVPGKKTGYTSLEVITGVLVHQGRVFMQRRLDSGVWAGFWEFPGGRLEPGETPEQGIVREFSEETEFAIKVTASLGVVRHAYTRYRIAMHCFLCSFEAPAAGKKPETALPEPVLHAATDYVWGRTEDMERVTMPAGHRKLVDACLPRIIEAMEASLPRKTAVKPRKAIAP